MPSRADVDMDLVLNDPICAREYIEEFDWSPLDPPKFVVWGADEKIYFASMSDKEAVIAAHIILRDVEKPREYRKKKLLEGIEIH